MVRKTTGHQGAGDRNKIWSQNFIKQASDLELLGQKATYEIQPTGPTSRDNIFDLLVKVFH